ncbi:hypothetical protein [Fluviicola sp.]|uniref:hypothetical protein n=1 Tax=Fluviicola sp. TaxID=1917219 RepID=UPI0031D1E15C
MKQSKYLIAIFAAAINFFYPSSMVFAQTKLKDIAGWEFHASANLPFRGERTFFGTGMGVNMLIKDTGLVSFKTGLEVNYFHTWDKYLDAGNFTNQRNVHYQHALLSIPAIVRFNIGNDFKLLVELGGYLGITLGGEMRSDYSFYDPLSNAKFNGIKHESYFPGLAFTPTLGIGGRFPLSERIDLLLKPECAFVMYEEIKERYFYARLCAGIHLKPKRK